MMQDQTKDRGTGKPLVGPEGRGMDVAQTLGRVLRCQKILVSEAIRKLVPILSGRGWNVLN